MQGMGMTALLIACGFVGLAGLSIIVRTAYTVVSALLDVDEDQP